MIDPYIAAAGKLRIELNKILDEGLTLQTVADMTGTQASTISRLARGDRSNPYIDTVLRIALAFNREPASLLPTLEQLRSIVDMSKEQDAAVHEE